MNSKVGSTGNIELVGRSYINTALAFLILTAVSGSLVQILILFKHGAGAILFVSLAAFLVVFILLLRSFWKTMATAYVRGEMVVVKYLNGDVRITELRGIKPCRSHKFAGFSVSALKFRIDGKQHRVLLFGNEVPAENLSFLQKAA